MAVRADDVTLRDLCLHPGDVQGVRALHRFRDLELLLAADVVKIHHAGGEAAPTVGAGAILSLFDNRANAGSVSRARHA